MKKTAYIDVNLYLTINGMTIDEFQKEIEKLTHLLDEMKQLFVFRDEGENWPMAKAMALMAIFLQFLYAIFMTVIYRSGLGKDRFFWGLVCYTVIIGAVLILGLIL